MRDIEKILIFPNSKRLLNIVQKFLLIKENKQIFNFSKKFGNCYNVAKAFFDFYNGSCKLVFGTVQLQKPLICYDMLTNNEINEISKKGLNPCSKKVIKDFAKENFCIDEFYYPQHFWNIVTINNKQYFVDLSGYFQFGKHTKKFHKNIYNCSVIEYEKE